ncbi:glycosyltransferase family 2 protein [Streptococcus suis]|uniref:Cps9G n=1 Tax=Streptococcus suis TaxID=1307 RepID=M1VDP7_STRSU|nr:glycosyltransferase [Streptococcus suis]NQH63245.1 glycosyltransferase [Streptococcus suis]NQH67351.1 glycosyltransferase [Streptococcus suis]NQH77751.1 glycosyltransferase [Streptococcus suis]NQH94304.1 glycosyltransferase [Streptococcus suis]NQM40582.1 glycosyltransferase [Streptococcus suis]
MKFSVLMSVYEKEDPNYLRNSLESILINQTVIPTEVVLVEDGPLTGGLYSVLEEFKSRFSFFKTISLKSNVGLGKALNEGLKHCSFEWVARMDSDDIAVNNRFEIQLNYLEKYPSLDLLGGSIIEFGTALDDIKSQKSIPTDEKDIINYSKTRNPFCHMTVFFKKSAVLDVGGYQHLPYVEDYYLWVRMLAANKRVANLPDILVYARVGNGLAERRSNRAQIVSWKILNDFMLEQGMISKMNYIKNMISIRLFVYIPAGIKRIIYRHILR